MKMKAPADAVGLYLHGVVVEIEDGLVDVSEKDVNDLLFHGFTVVREDTKRVEKGARDGYAKLRK